MNYGKWTVIGEGGRNQFGHRMTEVQCACGTVSIVAHHALKAGKSTQCRKCALLYGRRIKRAAERRQQILRLHNDGMANIEIARSLRCSTALVSITVNLTGERYNSWTVIEFVEPSRHGMAQAMAKCDCGSIKKVLLGNLIYARSKQCRACADKKQADRLSERSAHIRQLIELGWSRKAIAAEYGITSQRVGQILAKGKPL